MKEKITHETMRKTIFKRASEVRQARENSENDKARRDSDAHFLSSMGRRDRSAQAYGIQRARARAPASLQERRVQQARAMLGTRSLIPRPMSKLSITQPDKLRVSEVLMLLHDPSLHNLKRLLKDGWRMPSLVPPYLSVEQVRTLLAHSVDPLAREDTHALVESIQQGLHDEGITEYTRWVGFENTQLRKHYERLHAKKSKCRLRVYKVIKDTISISPKGVSAEHILDVCMWNITPEDYDYLFFSKTFSPEIDSQVRHEYLLSRIRRIMKKTM